MKKTAIAIAMILTAAAGNASDLRGSREDKLPRPATCGIKVVSYRFIGTPGTAIKYAGRTFTIPAEGEIELVADKKATAYEIGSSQITIDPAGAPDRFGSVTVPVANAVSLASAS